MATLAKLLDYLGQQCLPNTLVLEIWLDCKYYNLTSARCSKTIAHYLLIPLSDKALEFFGPNVVSPSLRSYAQ